MRALCLVIMFAAAEHAGASQLLVSPNGKLEAYTTANLPNASGMKLYLHRVRSRGADILLWQNNRWIDARWSPDSRFLALTDHPDGHVSDVYVFGVTAADAAAPLKVVLLYHTPNPFTYDVKWEIVRWHLENRELILRKEVRGKNVHAFATHTVTAKIGTKALPYARPTTT
jgi:hypothetical protein